MLLKILYKGNIDQRKKNSMINFIYREQRIILKVVLCDQTALYSEIFSRTNQIKSRL